MSGFNQYMEGAIDASLGTLLIIFGVPCLATIPRVGKKTPSKEAFIILFHYFQFFVSCTLLGYALLFLVCFSSSLRFLLTPIDPSYRAMIALRVVTYEVGADYNTAYIAAAIPAGAIISLCGLLLFRLILLFYALVAGTIIGLIVEAGLNNLFNTEDPTHSCTSSRHAHFFEFSLPQRLFCFRNGFSFSLFLIKLVLPLCRGSAHRAPLRSPHGWHYHPQQTVRQATTITPHTLIPNI